MRSIQLMCMTRQLKLNKVQRPKFIPELNNVLVKVSYAPINPSDLGYIFNLYGRYQHLTYPCNLGFEGSGTIEECNDKNQIGKKVIFWTNYEKENFLGTWTDYTLLDKHEYLILPDSYTDMRKASCLFINPLTALCFIDILKKNNCSSFLHTAGASAVGKILTKLSKRHNMKIINTVRKSDHVEELNKIGSSFTINTSDSNYKEQLIKAKDMIRPKIAFECIGGEMAGLVLKILEEEGVLYHYGNLSLKPISNVLSNDLIFLNKQIKGFWLFKYLYSHNDSNAIFKNYFEELKVHPDLYESNINEVFKPESFDEAIKVYKSQMSKGKVLLDFN